MEISKIVRELNLEIVAGYDDKKEVEGVYIGDLLSIVMAKAKKNDAWITIQTHINTIAVATLVELSAIIVVEGMDVDSDTIDKANEVKLPILRTHLTAYEVACKLNKLGL